MELWKGYKKEDFSVNGRNSVIVYPDKPADGNPWVWRTEFFGAFDYADMDMVKNGRFVLNHAVCDMYGCPQSVEMMKEFYDYAVKTYNLSSKPSLFGFSRGGLYAVNFALRYPDCVSCLYLDAPVTDIRSWPGGLLPESTGDEECAKECMDWYGIKTKEEYLNFKNSPNDNAAKIAELGIPTIIVAGQEDKTVPVKYNCEVFIRNFRENNLTTPLKVIFKPFCDHHPHSLEDPAEITEFIRKYDCK